MTQVINDFPSLLLIFVRVVAFFGTAPIFSYKTIPNQHKIGIAALLSWLIFLSMDLPAIEIDGMYFLLIIKEVLVGLIIGLVAFIILTAIQVAGGFIDFTMGLAIANVIDPQTGVQSPIIGQYLYTFSLFLLLVLNGHHILLDGIFHSYQIIPLENVWINVGNGAFVQVFSEVINSIFMVAFQMSIPVVGSIFLVEVALGIVARTVPQLNIFVVGIPLKIIVGIMLLILSIPVFLALTQNLFEYMFSTMREIMEIIGGR